MEQIIRIGMDTSKNIFQLHGVDAAEQVVLRKKLRRQQVLEFFAKLAPTVVGMEACGAAHYWARELRKLGHEVKLMAPQHVKPYVKRNKNDGRDAEAMCEAMSRPTMRFVRGEDGGAAGGADAGGRPRADGRAAHAADQRDPRLCGGVRADCGQGADKIEPLLAGIAQDESVPELARELFATAWQEYAQLQVELKAGRGPADGLAPRQRQQPAPGPDPRGRSDRRLDAGDEDTRSAGLPLPAGTLRPGSA